MITQFNPASFLGGYRRNTAQEHLKARRYAEARAAFAEALQSEPGNGDLLLGMAEAEIYSDRPQEGLQCLQQVISREPSRVAAYSLATVALLDLHAHEKVLEVADAALRLDAADIRARVNKATALYYLGRLDVAAAEISHALAIRPDYIPALITLGLIENGRGATPAAMAAFAHVLDLNPDNFTAHLNLSALETAQRHFDAALHHADRALALHPEFLPARINRSAALLSLGRFVEALEATDAILARDPANVQARQHRRTALAGLGRMDDVQRETDTRLQGEFRDVRELQCWLDELQERGENEAALAALDSGLARFGPLPQLLERQAGFQMLAEDFEAALASAQRVLADVPDSLRASLTASGCLHELGRDAESLEWAEAACRAASPPSLHALMARASGLAMQGRFDEAARDMRQAENVDPALFQEFLDRETLKPIPPDRVRHPLHEPRGLYVETVTKRFRRCDWRGLDGAMASMREWLARSEQAGGPSPINPYGATMLPLSGREQLRVSRQASDFIEREMAAARARCAFEHGSAPAEKLKIGYVSPDFRSHAVYVVTKELFQHHDRDRVEIYAYALYPGGMEVREQVRAQADHYVELAGLSNEEAARRIHADGIHILVDMAGYTAHARSEIFALRPAPLQVSYMGFPGSTGAPWLDYVVATGALAPPALEHIYSERVIRLPGAHIVRSSFDEDAPPTRAEMGLPDTGVVYACFQDVRKYDPETYDCWLRILKRVAGSVLWLYVEDRLARDNLIRRAMEQGVAPERIIFAEKVPLSRHIARQRLADLFLDTPLYSGITTVAMALWAGLPVLTWPRESYASRMGAAGLEALGVTDTIVHSLDAYEEMAVALGKAPSALRELRARVEAAREGCALFDARGTVRAMEDAYHEVWRRHLSGAAPTSLDVPPRA